MAFLFGRSRVFFPGRARLERTVDALAGEVGALRERLSAAEDARAAAERSSGEVQRMGQRLDLELDKFARLARDVVLLSRRMEEAGEATEAHRLKLAALAKRVDWETDSTRKSIVALFASASVGMYRPETTGEIADIDRVADGSGGVAKHGF